MSPEAIETIIDEEANACSGLGIPRLRQTFKSLRSDLSGMLSLVPPHQRALRTWKISGEHASERKSERTSEQAGE